MTKLLHLWLALAVIPTVGAQLTGVVAADAVSRETRPRTDSIIGYGIDTGTGAFALRQETLTLQGVRPIGFSLSYNSLLIQNSGALGPGWSHDYEARLEGDPNDVVTVFWDANHKNRFRFAGNGQRYEPLDESSRYDRLTRTGNNWRLVRIDGTQFDFNQDGDLTEIRNRKRQPITIGRRDGQVRDVTEASGKRVSLFYSGNRVSHLADNADRLVHFSYDRADRLETIRGPGTQGRVFGAPFESRPIPDSGGVLRIVISVSDQESVGLLRLADAFIRHERPSDLAVRLRSPGGTIVQITTSTDLAFWRLDETVIPFFNGEDPRGDWILEIADRQPGSTGSLESWRMRLTEEVDSVRYAYNSSSQIVSAVDADSRRLFANSYDAAGRIVAQDDGRTDNEAAQISYQDNGSSVITTYTDRTGAVSRFEHDAVYRLVSFVDPVGSESTYGYDAQGDRIRVTDALGRNARFAYTPDGDLASYTDASGATWTFEYSDERDLTAIRDPMGKRTEFEYQQGRLTRVKDAECLADPGCAGVRKDYGGDGELLSNILSDGAGINYTWRNGRPTGATHPARGGLEQADYDSAGRLTRFQDADGFERRFEYNSNSQIVSQTDPLGAISTRRYDRRGQTVRSTDARGAVTSFEYDGNGNLIARTNSLGETVRFEYDGEDRLIRTINPRGNSSTREYDAAGRLVQETDDAGVGVRIEYDAVGNAVVVYDGDDTPIERTFYDERDLPVRRIDAFRNETRFQYDSLGRLIESRDAVGDAEVFIYDRNDRIESMRDALGRTRSQEYEHDDVLRSIVDPQGTELEFEYDAANQLQQVSGENGVLQFLTYNRRDLIVSEEFLLDGLINPIAIDYDYDDAGRIERVRRQSAGVLEAELSFERDPNGNLTVIESRDSFSGSFEPKLSFDYDPLNRLLRYRDGAGRSLLYDYDAAGNLTTLTYPDGKRVRYVYDEAERLSEIEDWAGRRTRYSYDRLGRLSEVRLPNGVVQSFDYDASSRLIRRTDRSGGATFLELRYSYDALSRLSHAHASPAPPPFQQRAAQMTYGPDNRLATYNGQDVEYNARGALTRGPLNGTLANFDYFLSGNLSRAGNNSYAYDEQDRLIEISGPDGVSRFTINPAPALAQPVVLEGPGPQVTRYVWGPGLVYEEKGGRIRTYHYDHAGNTVALVDDAGVVSGRIGYDPYGEILSRNGDADTPFLYGGLFGLVTDSNGLVYMRYRWYSPEIKRFLTLDSEFGRIDATTTSNRYAYAGLDPVNFNDPNGRFLNVIVGAIAGAAVNVVATTVTTGILEGRLPTKGELAGAALEGAVGGALFATCGPGCGVAAAALIGGGSAALGSLARQGIDNGSVDPVELGVDSGFGVGFGAFAGRVGGEAPAPRFAEPDLPGQASGASDPVAGSAIPYHGRGGAPWGGAARSES